MAFKTFASGAVLFAAELNTYLMNQSVMTFADAAARNAALPTPTEGMICYLNDVNQYQMNLSGTTGSWNIIAGQMPRLSLTLGSAVTITTGSTTNITGWFVGENRGFSTPAGAVITVPLSGRYNITFVLIHAAINTTGGRGSLITFSAGPALRHTLPAPQSAAHSQTVYNTISGYKMLAGETITLQGYQNSGSSNTVTTDSFFIIEFVGP